MKFPIGGIVREPHCGRIWCNSKTDSIVWMEEDGQSCAESPRLFAVVALGCFAFRSFFMAETWDHRVLFCVRSEEFASQRAFFMPGFRRMRKRAGRRGPDRRRMRRDRKRLRTKNSHTHDILVLLHRKNSRIHIKAAFDLCKVTMMTKGDKNFFIKF